MGLGGIPVVVELAVRAPDGEEVHAAKRIFFAARIPPERTANQNPFIEALLARGAPLLDGEPLRVGRAEQIELEPVESQGVREVYVTPTLDGDTRTFTENLRYSWLATGGGFSDETTGGAIDLFGNVPLLETRWRAPEAPGELTLWVVQRDERGGASTSSTTRASWGSSSSPSWMERPTSCSARASWGASPTASCSSGTWWATACSRCCPTPSPT
jgi:hypothetical protein